MNKKFSTLAVAAMLASAFTAYAGPGEVVTKLAEGNNGKQYQLRALVENDDESYYLTLGGKDGDLMLVKDPNAYIPDGQTKPVSVLGNSLWCVDVTVENQGKNPIFDFINKGFGSVLDVTVGGWSEDNKEWTAYDANDNQVKVGANAAVYWIQQKTAHVGGEVRGWEFTPVLGSDAVPMFGVPEKTDADNAIQSTDISRDKGMYSLNSYISSTHIATLVWDESEIRVAVVKADQVSEIADKQVKFFLQEAYPVDLTADQFNTILNTQDAKKTVKMTFDKDYNNTDIINLLSTNEFNAVDVTGAKGIDCDNTEQGCKLGDAKGHNFVYLYKTEADATKNYLRVDTAYANGYGTKFLTFAFESDFGTGKTVKDEAIIPDQYKFRLNYCPTDDSLSIQVMSALYKLQDDGKPWRTLKGTGDAALKDGEKSYGKEGVAYTVASWTYSQKNHPSELKNHVTNWVKLQDLELATESRIITIGDAPINTHISFGYGDCAAVASEYTSVADGVYYIKNAKGQYLAHPIYNNGESKPLFVTVNADEQEVAHMPAYQWVVLKKYTDTGASQATSPVLIANREFDENFNTYASIQLKQAEGAKYMYVMNNVEWANSTENAILTTDSLQFEAVPTASVEDQYLGYKKIDADSLLVNKYTFNYWHPYATDKFIAKSDKDSTLTVLDGKDAFGISEIDDIIKVDPDKVKAGEHFSTVDIKYGFGNTKNEKINVNGEKLTFEDIQKRIPGLAQLVRTVYEVDLNNSYWKVNTSDQFNVGSYKYNNSNYDQAGIRYYAFFKENNHVDGKDYYAIVRATSYDKASKEYDVPTAEFVIEEHKAGVSDYDGAATLKNQVLVETRTSSFAIERDETPLYRRFNSTLEGQAGDGVDTLRFYEKYRNEYLMIEANPSFMVNHIDFLGIDAQDKAQGGLAFIVDTAWVNRGAGNIKPQYLISIDRHDYQGVAGEPCTEAGPHIDESGHITEDPMECVHAHKAVPGFKRGKFLINFHNFANNNEMVGADKYKWAEYDRAGFKEAIVVKDTLYILRDEFKNLKNEEIDLAKIASAEVEAQKAYSKKNGNLNGFLNYRYELTGDNHKYVTWSMRFFDRSVAANEVEADRAFLFESMKSLDGKTNTIHDDKAHTGGKYSLSSADGDIAPEYAAWLKMQNGCLVLSDQNSRFNEVVTGADDALIFNVEHVDGDKVAVDNENIAVEGVSVVAGNGQVTIMGAAGKNVTITNILGKVVASQVIASDNATIAVPAGIVAVAVEGEAAVKAIVK